MISRILNKFIISCFQFEYRSVSHAHPYYFRDINVRRPLHCHQCCPALCWREHVDVVIARARENLAIKHMPARVRQALVRCGGLSPLVWAVSTCVLYHMAAEPLASVAASMKWLQSLIAAAIAPCAGTRHPLYRYGRLSTVFIWSVH